MFLLPAATKLWPRLCFYLCLWFCTQGGSPENPPGPGRPPVDQGEPPRTKENRPRTRETPRDQAEPPRPRRTPPGPGRPPRTRQNPPRPRRTPPGPGRHPPGPRRTPPEEDCSIRSMSGRYASYWNAFLFVVNFCDEDAFGSAISYIQLDQIHQSRKFLILSGNIWSEKKTRITETMGRAPSALQFILFPPMFSNAILKHLFLNIFAPDGREFSVNTKMTRQSTWTVSLVPYSQSYSSCSTSCTGSTTGLSSPRTLPLMTSESERHNNGQ